MSCKFVKFLALKGENVYNQVLWNKSRTVILMDGYMEDEMRNSVKKAAVTALVCVTAAGMMAGCGNKKLDGTKIAVTVNKQEIPFGVVSLAARMQQAQAEAMYKMYLGGSGSTDNIWSKDLSGNGTTLEDSTKDQAMEELHEMYTLQQHMSDYNVEITDDDKAAIKEAAKKFISANSKEALDEMGATEDVVEEVLTLYTIRNKMKTAIEADADTNVSDEEATCVRTAWYRLTSVRAAIMQMQTRRLQIRWKLH